MSYAGGRGQCRNESREASTLSRPGAKIPCLGERSPRLEPILTTVRIVLSRLSPQGASGKLATFLTNPRSRRPGHSTRAAFHFVARSFAAGLGWTRGLSVRNPAENAPGQAGRLPLSGQGGGRPLRGQGQVLAPSRPFVLSAEPGHPHGHPAAARP